MSDHIESWLERVEKKLDKNLEKTGHNETEIAVLNEKIKSQRFRNRINHSILYSICTGIAAKLGIDIFH